MSREHILERITEIYSNYAALCHKLSEEELTVDNRKLMHKIRKEALEEIGTLIERL